MLTKTEIAVTASRLNTTRDRDADSSRAMLLAINDQHGRSTVRAVIAEMQRQAEVRYEAVMSVFRGLPSDTTFAQAIAIKAARHDPVAQGWELQPDGTYAKLARRAQRWWQLG